MVGTGRGGELEDFVHSYPETFARRARWGTPSSRNPIRSDVIRDWRNSAVQYQTLTDRPVQLVRTS